MEVVDYKKNIEILIKETGINLNQIFDYTSTNQYFELYDEIFLFCQEFLDNWKEKEGVKGAIFYFHESWQYNAAATLDNGIYIVRFNRGYIYQLPEIYEYATQKFKEDDQLKHYSDLPDIYGQNPEQYMFRAGCLFTFFHEFAHLLQFKSMAIPNGFVSESSDEKNVVFDCDRHSREWDSDIMAVESLYKNLHFEFGNWPIEHRSKHNYFKLLCLTISASLITMYKMHESFKDFYTFREEHPHPLIRTGYIFNAFKQLMAHLPYENFHFHNDSIDSQVHRICRGVTNFDPYELVNLASSKYSEMNYYLKFLEECSKGYTHLTFNKKYPI